MSELEAVVREVFEAGYWNGYRSGQRMASDVAKEDVIRSAVERLERLNVPTDGPQDGAEWTSWIDHASVRESRKE